MSNGIVRDTLLAGVLLMLGAGSVIAWHWPRDPERPVRINVRWSAAVTEPVRRTLEKALSLSAGELQESRTWQYTLSSTDRSTLEQIVRHDAVEDTHGIDRQQFVLMPHDLSDEAKRQLEGRLWGRVGRAVEAAQESRGASVFLFGVLAALVATLPIARAAGARLIARAPDLSPSGVRAFRLAIGIALAVAVALTPFTPAVGTPVTLQRDIDWLADWQFVHELAARPEALGYLTVVAVLMLLAFAVGLWPQPMLCAAALTLTLLTLSKLRLTSSHDVLLAVVAVWALVPFPWSRLADLSPRVRGYVVWLPGALLGLAFGAAAVAKLTESGLAWVTTGAVRYHFVEDAASARTGLGLWIASHEQVAVLVSGAVVLAELGMLAALVARRSPARGGLGVLAASLLLGFFVLQGVFWPGWWALLIGFLPWNLMPADRMTASPARQAAPAPQGVFRTATWLVVSQVAASLTASEHEPVLSHFPMYATTYASPASFNDAFARKSRSYVLYLTGTSPCAHDVTSIVERVPNLMQSVTTVVEEVEGGPTVDPALAVAIWDTITTDVGAPRRATAEIVVHVGLGRFDFATGLLEWTAPRPVVRLTAQGVFRSDAGVTPCGH